MIDTHCHLNMPPLNNHLEKVLARAEARGVRQVIIPAYDLATWPEIVNLTQNTGLYAALGIHPWVAHTISADEIFGVLSQTIIAANSRVGVTNKIVAIGEIGLDTKIDSPSLEIQLPVLRAQLKLAVELDLPVILHCRGAFHDLFQAINEYQGKIRGVIHAFTKGPELVQRFHEAGFHFGLGGALTRESARQIKKGARVIPSHRLLLETDAPSMGLQSVLPQATEPGHVADVATALAALRGVDQETIARITTENARLLFGLPTL